MDAGDQLSGHLAATQVAGKKSDEQLEVVGGRFRRVRQEQITSELLSLVSSVEPMS